MRKKTVLVIVAHPDDEILGCGGTIAKLTKAGYEAFTVILGEGITSRFDGADSEKKRELIKELKQQAAKANKIIGVKDVMIYNFPDNRLDTVPLLDIVKTIEKVKNKIKPDIIFTHYEKDLNIDHRVVYKAVITASRPLSSETVKEIYSFEVLSSTEWNYPLSFSPDVFFEINDTLKCKIRSIKTYRSELRESRHPRSLKGVLLNAEYWGIKTGLKYAEAFKSVRIIK